MNLTQNFDKNRSQYFHFTTLYKTYQRKAGNIGKEVLTIILSVTKELCDEDPGKCQQILSTILENQRQAIRN